LVVNKPKDMTSHDVVDYVRRQLGIRRVGHAGTLDPFATGVLVILIGRFTKYFGRFLGWDKEYAATLTLGAKTTTADITGRIIQTEEPGQISEENIREALAYFQGEIQQVPPMYSALKYKGRPLYAWARQGIEVQRQARKVRIKELRLLKFSPPQIQFYLQCSSGTYVRSLGEEISQKLGCLGYLSALERQSVGPFHIHQAIALSKINPDAIIDTFDGV